MVHRLFNVVLPLEPLCGAPVQFSVAGRVVLAQLLVQEVAEQIVVAIGRRSPSPKAGDEEVAPLHLRQQGTRLPDLQDLAAQP